MLDFDYLQSTYFYYLGSSDNGNTCKKILGEDSREDYLNLFKVGTL